MRRERPDAGDASEGEASESGLHANGGGFPGNGPVLDPALRLRPGRTATRRNPRISASDLRGGRYASPEALTYSKGQRAGRPATEVAGEAAMRLAETC